MSHSKGPKGQKGTETHEDVLARIQRGHANNYLHRVAETERQNAKLALGLVIASAIAAAVILAAIVAVTLVLAVEAFNLETERSLEQTYDVRLVACERQHSAAYCAERVQK